MKPFEVTILAPWWHDPLLLAIISSVLTGLFFALVLFHYYRLIEKKDIKISIITELTNNYESIQKIQNIQKVNNLDPGLIRAIRKEMPWNAHLTDEDLFLDYYKNQPIEDELSTECWNVFKMKIAKYGEDYRKFQNFYHIIERIIHFSKIKKGQIKNVAPTEKAVVGQFSVIRNNSEQFIEEFEDFIGVENL